jgi:hypothetical protein
MGQQRKPRRGDGGNHKSQPSSSGMENDANGIIRFNGRFTINSPRGGHKTFQIKTAKGGKLKGKRILSRFFGRENTDDRQYEGFAFVTDTAVNLWGRFLGSKDHKVYVAMLIDMVAKGAESHYVKMGYELLMETRCRCCNRPLTNPVSIKTGIGPECAGRQSSRAA